MKKVAVLIVLLAAVAGGVAWNYSLSNGNGGSELTLYGNVDIREVQLGFRVAGRLESMYFEEGDTVGAGDLLASLDDKPMREALALADAGLMEAQANLDRATTGSRPQEIQQAEAMVAEAESGLDNANKQLKRQQDLFKDGLNSRSALDDAVAQQEQMAARLRASREALKLAVEGFRSEDIAAAQAGVAAAQARRAQAQTQLDDTSLLAPSSGVVLTRAREPGSMLAIGAPVLTLSLTEKTYVRAYVDESHLGSVVPGAKVWITSDSTDARYQGQVGFVSPRAEFTPKTVETPELRTDLVYRLRILVSDPDSVLRQGMPVTIEVPSAQG